MPDYVELRCRSAFSFLEGAANPEDLADRAAELGHPALALADRGGLYGAPRFFQAARAAGLHAIVGAEVGLEDARSLLLLVESPQGYRNLAKLLTAAHARARKGPGATRPRSEASWDEIEEHAAGLVCLARGDARLDAALLDRARACFGERLWVDVSRRFERSAELAARRAAALAEGRRVPVVATNDVACARPAQRPVLDALLCLRAKTTLDRAGRLLPPNTERCLLPREELERRFADRPAWIRASREIAERCEFTLGDLGYRFPRFPVPGGESQDAWLRRLTFEGARARYGDPLPPRARAQLEHELAVVAKLDLAGYFLIVHDVARFAREEQILAQGRGSAANSAVCYALGITAVDPVGMELLFERFLSEERGEWPDIDLDLPSGAKRERVIQYVFERYGERGAAMTATVITYRTRLAVREMGKVLGLDANAIDRLARVLTTLEHRDDLDAVARTLRQARVDPEAPRIRRLLSLVDAVQGLPRHVGQHTGGIVIAAGRLDEVVPIEPAAMAGRRVVQWDKDDCADLGIIKIDLLGLGMLDALERTLVFVRDHEGVAVDLAHLPPDDPDTYAAIRRADTVGTFQIESRAQMATLPRMQPRSFYDLVVEVAIIRPGPIVGRMVNPYLERRAGREPVAYPHPCLEPILARTLGVPIFQEQLLRVAMAAAGFTGGEAEELRRAMGFKRSTERMHRIEARLRAGMAARGIHGEAQEEIVRGITSFALYGFPESHAASFALIAYASAYLKVHHPAAFLAGLLNAYPMGFYSPATLVKDAQRHGVEVRSIDVAHSDWECTLERSDGVAVDEVARRCRVARGASRMARPPTDLGVTFAEHVSDTPAEARGGLRSTSRRPPRHPAPGSGPAGDDPLDARHRRATSISSPPAVRLGLRYVGGLREVAGRGIQAERACAPFASAADLVRRVALRRDELEALAELGALASLEPGARGRRGALWQVAALERDPRSLFAGVSAASSEPPVPEMSPLEQTLADYRLSGITVGPQILAHLRADLRRRGLLSAAELRAAPDGRFVRTAGHVIVRQRPGSAKGFCFLTLEDETGTSNAVLTPREFKRFRVPLHTASLLEIAGPVQNVDGVAHVRVRELVPLAPRDALPDSHDYR